MLHARSVSGCGGQLVRLLAAAVRLYSMDATALLPAVSGLRPIPSDPPIALLGGTSGTLDAAAVRRCLLDPTATVLQPSSHWRCAGVCAFWR